jgi:hypothetical protein
MWAATATEIAPSTKETRVGVLVRPVGEVFALSVWDIECNTLDLGYLPGRMVVAGASTRGELRILELDENALLQQVDWPVAVDRPFPSAQAWAGYHQYTMRADWPRTTTLPLGNATFVWEKGALATVGDMPVIIPDHLMAEVTRPEKVVGLYEYSESSDVNTINEYCRRIRTDWGKRFPTSPIPPVISYMHPAQIEAMGTAPTEVDIFAPQFYFSTDEMPPRIDYFSKMAWWMTQLPADRLWMPTVQTYDRNFQWSAANMSILAGQQGQLISLARAYPFITGYGCFAVNRPGGIVKWPVLRESLTKVATIGGIGAFPSRWPYRPPVEGTDPIDPPVPPVGEDDMTQADLERWTAAITDPMLFGALERWHNEVLPRDRPKDSIIKNGDNTDMWTGDVVTGGANGYFIRAQMLHYYIACSKGRPTDQAWGDGYDAAMRSYNKAVGRPQ